MRILMIGGFLGSGKTTIVKKIIGSITDCGETVAIIENELGEVGIDDAIIGQPEISVTPLFGGCVCCQIQGDLIMAVDKIRRDINPDWLIIELTGIAFMSGITGLFEKYGGDWVKLSSLAVVDSSRWEIMMLAMGEVLSNQLMGADMVLVNKTDITSPPPDMDEDIRRISGTDAIAHISAPDMTDCALWDLILSGLRIRGRGK